MSEELYLNMLVILQNFCNFFSLFYSLYIYQNCYFQEFSMFFCSNMSAVYPTLPKLAVRDNIDDDDLTDIDDEVFIRDGKNGGLKLDDDGGVKRPLMAPRRKSKKSCHFQTHKFPYKALLLPLCYGMTVILVLGLIVLCTFTTNTFPMPLTILKNWLSHEPKDSVNKSSEVIPCTSLSSKIVWTRSLPKLTSEAPLRSNDVNSDGIEDIIVGFSTGIKLKMAYYYGYFVILMFFFYLLLVDLKFLAIIY